MGAQAAQLYPTALDQCAWADQFPEITSVILSEHHGVDDGYCPSPVVLGGAVAGRTSRISMVLGALVLPLHDPLRMAEDLAVLDLVSGGRLVVVFAAGYRPEEFAMFDRPMAGRGRALEEAVMRVRAAWRGEEVHSPGGPVRITPKPASPGGPAVFLGGSSVAAARRAARVADGFMPGAPDPELPEAYRDECQRLGKEVGYVSRTDDTMGVFVAEDPEAAWARIAPHALHEVNSYASWEEERPGPRMYLSARDADELRRRGSYLVLTPDECVQYYRDLPEDGGLLLHPLLGGLAPEVGWASLELFANAVLPQLREDQPAS